MSKADKMFEDIKYVKMVDNEVYIHYASEKQNFLFDLVDKVIIGNNNVEVEEHLAIHEKLKELGWIK